ncbi:MAG: alpha/beta hydrolase-fold protein [Ferruginibacter sp.]
MHNKWSWFKLTLLTSVMFLINYTATSQQTCNDFNIKGEIFQQNNRCVVVPDMLSTFGTQVSIRNIRVVLPEDYKLQSSSLPVVYFFMPYIGDSSSYTDSLFINYFTGIKNKGILVCVEMLQETDSITQNDFRKSMSGLFNKSLKPWINATFKCQSSPATTIVSGIQEGADVALYLALELPSIIGKAGIFSPVMNNSEEEKTMALDLGKNYTNKIFFYNLASEDKVGLNKLENITDILGLQTSVMIYKILDENYTDEKFDWQKWFPEFLKWMYASGYNYVMKDVD